MIEESDMTLEQLHARWRAAASAAEGLPPGSRERAAAEERSARAAEAYRYRLEVMAQDLRDG